MEYLRVKYDVDNVYSHVQRDYITLVENELYTKRELDRLYRLGYKIPRSALETVRTSKNNVYFFFGARFAIDESKVLK